MLVSGSVYSCFLLVVSIHLKHSSQLEFISPSRGHIKKSLKPPPSSRFLLVLQTFHSTFNLEMLHLLRLLRSAETPMHANDRVDAKKAPVEFFWRLRFPADRSWQVELEAFSYGNSLKNKQGLDLSSVSKRLLNFPPFGTRKQKNTTGKGRSSTQKCIGTGYLKFPGGYIILLQSGIFLEKCGITNRNNALLYHQVRSP